MYSYAAYGLGIHSELPLPELLPGDGRADLVVHLGRVDPARVELTGEGRGWRISGDEACLFWQEVGTFLIRRGMEIVADPVPGVHETLLRCFLLGPVLAAALHQRGQLVLHASAVAGSDGAIAFLGEAGWGKSTLAAAFWARKYSVVADDLVVVGPGSGLPVVFPGFPQLKLWPEVAGITLGDCPEELPRIHPGYEKRARRIASRFQSGPLPLRRVYLLAEGEVDEIRPLPPQEGFLELIRHSYCVRMLQASGASPHFLQCAGVANRVSVHRVQRRRDLFHLPELVRMIEDDLGAP